MKPKTSKTFSSSRLVSNLNYHVEHICSKLASGSSVLRKLSLVCDEKDFAMTNKSNTRLIYNRNAVKNIGYAEYLLYCWLQVI